MAIHIRNYRIVKVSNEFKNKNDTIHERVCVIPLPYCIYWFERYYPNVPLNQDDGPFCIQHKNGIQGKNHLDNNGIDSLIQCSRFLNIRKSQLIVISTSNSSMMEQCPILQLTLIIFSTLLIMRQNFLN